MTDERDKDREDAVDWIQQRGTDPGRRKTDYNTCAMHDYLQNKNDHCFDIIKATIKDEIKARDHRFEILESRLENYISKWAFGLIVVICLSLLGSFFGMALWQIRSVDEKMSVVSTAVIEMTKNITLMSHNQQGMMRELESMGPEHKVLMDHLKDEKRHQ